VQCINEGQGVDGNATPVGINVSLKIFPNSLQNVLRLFYKTVSRLKPCMALLVIVVVIVLLLLLLLLLFGKYRPVNGVVSLSLVLGCPYGVNKSAVDVLGDDNSGNDESYVGEVVLGDAGVAGLGGGEEGG